MDDHKEALEVEFMTAKKEMVRAHFHTRCGISRKAFTPNRVTYPTQNLKFTECHDEIVLLVILIRPTRQIYRIYSTD